MVKPTKEDKAFKVLVSSFDLKQLKLFRVWYILMSREHIKNL